jgi:hypothetical protein
MSARAKTISEKAIPHDTPIDKRAGKFIDGSTKNIENTIPRTRPPAMVHEGVYFMSSTQGHWGIASLATRGGNNGENTLGPVVNGPSLQSQ